MPPLVRRPAVLLLALVLILPGPARALELAFERAGPATLANPHDVKLGPDGRYLFVGDVDNDRVALLDPETLEVAASFGEGAMSGARDVDFDPAGRAYVADTYSHRVLVYALDGTAATRTGTLDGGMRGPEGVLVHPSGRVYVAGAWSNNLVVYEDGRRVDELTGLARPHDVELAADGSRIWLADSGNDRMLLLTPDLEIVRELTAAAYPFAGPRYQDTLADGTLIVASKNNHSVLAIGPDGELLARIGDGAAGKGPGKLTTPEGVEVAGDRLYLADSGNDRIVMYRIVRGR